MAVVVVGCLSASGDEARSSRGAPSSRESERQAAAPVPSEPPRTPTSPAPTYPWRPHSTDPLDAPIAPPAGFTRVPVAEGSFGAFLRALPLMPAGAPVLDYSGRTVHDGGDPRIAAVVDIDVGKDDLQQCADAVLRMNAEWRYGRGDRNLAYPVASGTVLGYARYLAGERAFADGHQFRVRLAAAPAPDEHSIFRRYLDEVFAWANTASLARSGTPVPIAAIAPGDFFVMSGRPFGHAVLVLDAARDAAGQVALLLGQSYMPAQSFHVLSPGSGKAWFIVTPDATAVFTPFWDPFPIDSLRRF